MTLAPAAAPAAALGDPCPLHGVPTRRRADDVYRCFVCAPVADYYRYIPIDKDTARTLYRAMQSAEARHVANHALRVASEFKAALVQLAAEMNGHAAPSPAETMSTYAPVLEIPVPAPEPAVACEKPAEPVPPPPAPAVTPAPEPEVPRRPAAPLLLRELARQPDLVQPAAAAGDVVPPDDPDAAIFGTDLFGEARIMATSELGRKFYNGIPPFTVLDAQSGEWGERKDLWKAYGVHEDDLGGRSTTHTFGGRSDDYVSHQVRELGTTSVFDPVLCEHLLRWFCPAGGRVLDPFAGGSCRGLVAAALGYTYRGIDLRPEQIAPNQRARDRARTRHGQLPGWCSWLTGDSYELLVDPPDPAWIAAGNGYDFLLSCPPYGDLEVYSDDPRDLSTMPTERFLETHGAIIRRAAAWLKPNRFAAWVVAEYRGTDGCHTGFVPRTFFDFVAAGLHPYNHAILVTMLGTTPMRTGPMFRASRKLGPNHQHILVFVKGSWKAAAQAIAALEPEPNTEMGAVARRKMERYAATRAENPNE